MSVTRVRRVVDGACYVLYYGIAIKSPRSYSPGGAMGGLLRRLTAGPLLRQVGRGVNIEAGAAFGSGRELALGDRSGLGVDADIHGPVTIGNDVMMGPRCTILTRNHRIDDVTVPMNQQGFDDFRPVVVENDVWIGANVTIMPGVTVGTGAVLGAGAVVVRDVQPYAIVGGVPARMLGHRGRSPGIDAG